jgi:hypothetical protein
VPLPFALLSEHIVAAAVPSPAESPSSVCSDGVSSAGPKYKTLLFYLKPASQIYNRMQTECQFTLELCGVGGGVLISPKKRRFMGRKFHK